jgi:flavin-dependent dehydrogenase
MDDNHTIACHAVPYDTLIIGGGLAGLTLALQLIQADPSLKICVVERRVGPAPEAAFKVGESTVEIGAYYLNNVIGLHDHLMQDQLTKMGLRYFFSGPNGNADIAERFEAGAERFSPFTTYQLDRGRLENELMRWAHERGVEVITGAVQNIEIGQGLEHHKVYVASVDQDVRECSARWLVDASGRASLLKRKLDLDVPNKHDINAVWFRIAARVGIDDWSSAPYWRTRVETKTRWLSTNHLVGKGYWVWIIPLPSGSTSMGIVADPRFHSVDTFNTLARAHAWLAVQEPQLSRHLAHLDAPVQDFHVMTHCVRESKRLFSSGRWALTGEAGAFLDPLYSPGSDFIAMSNTFIVDMVLRHTKGENILERTEFFNSYMQSIFKTSVQIYRDQYQVLGNSRVMTKKLIWDTLVYWGTFAMVFIQNELCDLDLLKNMRPIVAHIQVMNSELQKLFREVTQQDEDSCNPSRMESGFLGLSLVRHKYYDLYQALLDHLTPEEVMNCLKANLHTLETTYNEVKAELRENRPSPLAVITSSQSELAMAGADAEQQMH